MKRSSPTPQHIRWDDMSCLHPNAAGLGIGASASAVAVPPARGAEPGRAFETFTPDLHALVDWPIPRGIATVAMASTGVYGAPVFELLEQGGLQPSLVDARHVETVPGRQRDWNDAPWLRKRHGLGLLRASCRPEAEMRIVRTLLRHRAELIERRAPHTLPLQKALNRMNMQLSEVLTAITGVTGQAILRAIVHGERDPLKLAQLRNPAGRSSAGDLAKALAGTWRDEQVCILQQALALFDVYTQRLAECDARVEPQFAARTPRFESDEPPRPVPRGKPGAKSKPQPRDDARAHLARITGVDLVAVTGISASMAQAILSEGGTDRSKFPTAKPFGSWLGPAPHNDVSGGKVLRSRTLQVVSRATQALRQAAQAVARSGASFGAYFRARRARRGPQQAAVATAHTIARVV